MAFDSEQVGILRGSALALAFALAAVGAGYAWLSARWFGLSDAMTMADSAGAPSRRIVGSLSRKRASSRKPS